MQRQLAALVLDAPTTLVHYRFEAIHATLLVPFGKQDGFSVGLQSKGTQVIEKVDAGGRIVERSSSPFELTFAVRRATGDRWLNVGVLPTSAPTAVAAVPGIAL
jgi:hypothetical protein